MVIHFPQMKYGLASTLLILASLTTACRSAEPSPTVQITQTPQIVVVTSETSAPGTNDPGATPVVEVFPTPLVCDATIIEQPFENGRMFWVGKTIGERCRTEHEFTPGSGEIWVAVFEDDTRSGEWFAVTDTFDESVDAPFDVAMTAPPGVLQPVRGFGKVWREALTDEQREALGWGTGQELAFLSQYRYDAGGVVDANGNYVPRPGQHVLISFAGERFFLDEQTGRFEFIPAE